MKLTSSHRQRTTPAIIEIQTNSRFLCLRVSIAAARAAMPSNAVTTMTSASAFSSKKSARSRSKNMLADLKHLVQPEPYLAMDLTILRATYAVGNRMNLSWWLTRADLALRRKRAEANYPSLERQMPSLEVSWLRMEENNAKRFVNHYTTRCVEAGVRSDKSAAQSVRAVIAKGREREQCDTWLHSLLFSCWLALPLVRVLASLIHLLRCWFLMQFTVSNDTANGPFGGLFFDPSDSMFLSYQWSCLISLHLRGLFGVPVSAWSPSRRLSS